MSVNAVNPTTGELTRVAGNTFSMEYIRNQNILSDLETITIPASAATAITMEYDGYLYHSHNGTSLTRCYVNGVNVANANNVSGTATAFTIYFRKGDTIYYSGSYSIDINYVRYFKLRDYTGRT